jgi:ABC-type nitrate/sulfonate/bicarbonate transport system substrate-binding protein
VYVRRNYLAQNREVVKRFLKAYSEAVRVLRTDKEKSLRVLAKRMRLDDREILEATYNYFGHRFSYPPKVDLLGVRDTLEFYAESNPELKNRKPGQFVDHSLLEELENEGFFSGLH